MKAVVAAIVLVGIAIVLLGVKALFVKGGRFPSMHAHDALRRRAELMARLEADRENASEKTKENINQQKNQTDSPHQ